MTERDEGAVHELLLLKIRRKVGIPGRFLSSGSRTYIHTHLTYNYCIIYILCTRFKRRVLLRTAEIILIARRQRVAIYTYYIYERETLYYYTHRYAAAALISY